MHMMKYCSACGSTVVSQPVNGEPRPRFVCLACQMVHYRNPEILVCGIVHYDHRLLMCRRALEPGRGLWAVPAGFMEEGESIEQAAARETEEETGVVIDPQSLELYAVLSLPLLNQVYLALRTELKDMPRLTPGLESLEVAFCAEDELDRDDWAFFSPLVEDGTSMLFREIRAGTFGVHKMTVGGPANTHQIRTYDLARHKQCKPT